MASFELWLRREPADPPVFSVRFRADLGTAQLRLPAGWGPVAGPAASGVVAGLRYADLARCMLLRFDADGRSRPAVPVTEALGGDPRAVAVGSWLRCPLSRPESPAVPKEPTIDPGAGATDVGLAPALVVAEEERTDLGLPPSLPPSEELDTGKLVAARPAPTLVRSLMRRIREQEAEIRTLRARIAALEKNGG